VEETSETGEISRVAVLGAGRMGAAMARKLAAAGHTVSLWNRTAATANQVVASYNESADPSANVGSLRAFADPSDAVAGAGVVVSMLADGTATQAVFAQPGVLSSLASNAVVCDMATSGVAAAHALAETITAAGRRFIDAPVSGSVPTVAAGQLLVMAGGNVADVAAASVVFAAFAKRVIHTGAVGTGQAMKLAVNLVVHDLNAAVSEALVLATSSGIAAEAAYDVFESSVVAAPFVQYKRAAFLTPDVPVAMSLDLVAKDLSLITAQADRLGVPAIVTRAVQRSVGDACNDGYGAEDMASLARHLASRA
jgi:3-hydroxyisobutyrate dehydrogenase